MIRDSGSQRRSRRLERAEQRWTVSHKATSIHAAARGYGYAWFPEDTIRDELARGPPQARCRCARAASAGAELYLVFADRDSAGRARARLAEIIRARSRGHVPARRDRRDA